MSDNAGMDSRVTPTSPSLPISPTMADSRDQSSDVQDVQFDAALALLRLAIGGTFVGADELRNRLQRWEETTRAVAQEASPLTPTDLLRYAFVGMLFETETSMRRGFSTMLARLSRLSDEANYFYTRFAQATRRTPLDPLRMRLDEMLFLAMASIDRWSARGWIEEQRGRRMAQQATVSVIDELLEYMARNPEVRQLIEQQGMSMAGTAVDEVRNRTASADLWIERLAHSLLHRSASDKPAKAAGNVEALLPNSEAPEPTSSTGVLIPAPEAKAQTSGAAASTNMRPSGDPGV